MSKIENDKYYTPKELARRCIDKVYEIIGRENITEVIEPSAGNGSFSSQIPGCIAYDIKPEAEGIKKQDFLDLFTWYKKGRLVIGNPPFGINNFGCINFFNKSIEIADYVAFILPISFLDNDIKFYQFDLVYSEDLGEQLYTDRNLHCCFNIYKRPAGGLNPKPDYTLKDVTIIEHRRKKGEYHTGANKPIPPNFDYSMCNWGSGCLGKRPTYIGEYAQEVYIYVNNKKYKDKVIDLLSYDKIRNYVKSISMKRISVMKLYKYLKENIEGIK